MCANLVGIRQAPGDTAGLELRLQLPLGGLLLGRLVWGGKVSRAAVQWGARGQAQGPSGAPARLLLTEHRCGAAAGARTEPPIIGTETCKSLSLGFHRLVAPPTSPSGARCFEKSASVDANVILRKQGKPLSPAAKLGKGCCKFSSWEDCLHCVG